MNFISKILTGFLFFILLFNKSFTFTPNNEYLPEDKFSPKGEFSPETEPVFIMDPPFCLPRRFRATDNKKKVPIWSQVSTNGLYDLNIMGSGQFSKEQLECVKKTKKAPIIVVDSRQESHGFIDGIPVTWYGERDWANYAKSDEEIRNIESNQLDELLGKKGQDVKIYKNFKKKEDEAGKGMIPGEETTLKVNIVSSEKELAENLGLKYERFYIPDHWRMSDKQVDQFVEFVKKVPRGRWVYFHCRGGVGRTTSLMVMYDIMRNAKTVSLKDILRRQQLIGGRNLSMKFKGYKEKLAEQRWYLMQKFYEYCKSNNDNFQTSWTKWLKRNAPIKPLGKDTASFEKYARLIDDPYPLGRNYKFFKNNFKNYLASLPRKERRNKIEYILKKLIREGGYLRGVRPKNLGIDISSKQTKENSINNILFEIITMSA